MTAATVYFEDIAEGDEAPVRSLVLSRTDLVAYAGASGDFNPMLHDEVKATAAGQPSVFGHGMFSMGFLGSAVTDYVGIGNVRRFQANDLAHWVRAASSPSAIRTATDSVTNDESWSGTISSSIGTSSGRRMTMAAP